MSKYIELIKIKNYVYLIAIIFVLLKYTLKSEPAYGSIDTVYDFFPGKYIGQDSINPYFPQNIFGEPSKQATETIPASSYEQIQLLGMGGEIIVGFKNKFLVNGPGYDFTIFENAFINPINGGCFAEPGKVAVSRDGINYYEFKYNNQTLKGLAGITPTYGDKNPYNPNESGGDSFDLSELGIDTIKYIKITDFTSIISTLPDSNKFWNPEFILTGFDLDAVLGFYLIDANTSDIKNTVGSNGYKLEVQIDGNCRIINCSEKVLNLKLYNINCTLLENRNLNRNEKYISEIFVNGLYFIVMSADQLYDVHKVLIAN